MWRFVPVEIPVLFHEQQHIEHSITVERGCDRGMSNSFKPLFSQKGLGLGTPSDCCHLVIQEQRWAQEDKHESAEGLQPHLLTDVWPSPRVKLDLTNKTVVLLELTLS